jgi:hypothetical protein
MKWLLLIIPLFLNTIQLQAQTDSLPKPHPRLTITAGLWASNSMHNWMNVRIGIEAKRHTFLIGAHRLLQYRITYSNRLASIRFVPWPVGVDLWYRYHFASETARLSPFFLLSLSISRTDQEQNPLYFPDPQRLGAWMEFEPTVGYGIRWNFTPHLAIAVEAGAGLYIYQYFPIGQKPEPGYWPAGFMGMISLEKAF